MTTLYEISTNLRDILSQDEISKEDLSATCNSLNEKALNIGYFSKNMEADIDALDSEIKRLKKKKETLEKKQEWLYVYLKDCMELNNIQKIDCPVFTIKLRECPPSVLVKDDWIIPDEYYIIKTDKTLNKNKIRQELKDGKVIDGVELTRNIKVEIK